MTFSPNLLLDVGSSADPCNPNYAGPAPFSEPETRAIRDFVTPIKDKIDLYLALHNFGQLLLWPFGTPPQSPVPNLNVISAVSDAYVASQKANGAEILAGPAQFVLGTTAGTARDWAYGALNISLVYTIEFEPDINSDRIFYLENSRIRQNAERFVDSVGAIIRAGQQFGLFKYEPITWKDITCKLIPALC